MSDIRLQIDGKEVMAKEGMTVLQGSKVQPGVERRGFLRVHVPLFLTADGEVLRERGMWHDLGVFVTGVVVVGSRRLAGKRSGQIGRAHV